MKRINLYSLVLPFCILLGGFGLIAFIAWMIPIIGDFFHNLDEDDKWIHLSIVIFIGFSALAYYHVKRRKKDNDLLGTYDDKL